MLAQNYGKIPLSFEANQGQTDARVKFLSRGPGYTLFLTGDEVTLELAGSRPGIRNSKFKTRNSKFEIGNQKAESAHGLRRPLIPNLESSFRVLQAHTHDSPAPASAVLRIRLVGANPAAKVKWEEELPGKSNYFIGNDPKKWRTNVPTYAKVKYAGVYPGVDLVYYGNQRQLEHDFVVAPGADPSRIALRVEGSKEVSLDAEGNLDISVEGGNVHLRKPLIYQEGDGGRREISGGYVMRGAREVSFRAGAHDPAKPLVIDPVLAYSTYLGGNGYDLGYGIAAESSGNVYVTGSTSSTNFPTTPGAYQALRGGRNAFVTELNPSGSALVYSTFLGGSMSDGASAIAVDSSGNAYLTGYAFSNDFPTTPGAFQTSFAGVNLGNSTNAFVTKLNPSGSALVYSTYLGGTGYTNSGEWGDQGFGIAVDSSGHAYVAGETPSSNFPTTAGAFQTSLLAACSTCQNAFVTELNPSGTALVYSTYLGGSGGDTFGDSAQGIAVDSSGNAYVTGLTYSSNFPTTPGAFQTTCRGCSSGWDSAFVTKLNPDGSTLAYSTYLGGSAFAEICGVALDSSGNAYVTGTTNSGDFPTTPGAFQTALAGGNAFVTKLNPSGSALVYSTFFGGSVADVGYGIGVDPSGNAYVTGLTYSSNFPTTAGAFQTSLAGFQNPFVTILNPSGSALLYSTYLGGSGRFYQSGQGIAVDPLGNAYVTGQVTLCTDFPTTPQAFQTTLDGIENAFVAKFQNSPQAQVTNLQNTVKNLVSTGTLRPAVGQFLLAPLNAALAALGPDPATAAIAASGPIRTADAIRDLHEFIDRVRLLTIFGALRRAEGQILVNAANSLITALRG